MTKRLLDLFIVTVALLLLWPLLIGIAIAVCLDSPGPALFRQVRVARGGRPFQILKFRTMRATPLPSGPLLTAAGDSRITAVGAVLRRTKLDELPQLINVLKGDMSLVGPRPEVPKYVALYPPEVRELVLSVRPGITDDAAIEFSDESALLANAADPERVYLEDVLPRKLRLYVDYVRNHTLAGDLRILARTLQKLAKNGARGPA
jgi:lipopolysaccharide/colanic/teichoic acid biosynthesis glycosyltransferase